MMNVTVTSGESDVVLHQLTTVQGLDIGKMSDSDFLKSRKLSRQLDVARVLASAARS
jgi:hypothetical protein